MSEHSIIPPSSAYIWGKPNGCTGWVKMAQLCPEEGDTKEAEEGTKAHKLAELIMVNGADGNDYFSASEDMVEAAQMYAADVNGIVKGNYDPSVFGIETRIEAPGIHPESFGTVDCWFFDVPTSTLYVWDFKFGFVTVEAFENWQAINYVVGLITALGRSPLKIDIRIVQPRAPHLDGRIRSWKTTTDNVFNLAGNLQKNAHVALSDEATLNPGSHCRFCQARHVCKALHMEAMYSAEESLRPELYELDEKSLSRELLIVLKAEDMLKYRRTGLTAQVESLMQRGKGVPGFSLEHSPGRLNWNASNEELNHLGELLNVQLRKDSFITPTQAKKKGISEDIIRKFASRNAGKVSLVPDNINKIREKLS